ncbi:Hpt domain-containing protein [Porticoccus litoralis]|uniref:Chemotaxis protein CheA n=1 Tax=Porticoccus litoralis TaxID=434086 RepID=A0AAW8B3D1_9GAMM|nr:Hpt domain-containing protein [Porticoccus litoralis]MDP1520863.1 Hpt domain-containing protein [Porticoccus litoralis]
MEQQGKLQGLSWLTDEVETSLNNAAEALEIYLDHPDNDEPMRRCLSLIHEVHGSLKMAECHGPLLLADEMEQVAQRIINRRVMNVAEAGAVLVQAILTLPGYLRQLLNTRQDQPETLLLLLNELRAIKSEPLVSETAYFTPQMLASEQLSKSYNRQPDPVAMTNLLRKLRQMYQYALLGVVKGEKVEENFGYLDKVFSRLRELSKGMPREPLWNVVLALLEGIAGKEIKLGQAVQMLLRQLEVEIRRLSQAGYDGLMQPMPKTLLKNLLFYIAHGKSQGPRSTLVRELYHLDQALPDVLVEEADNNFSALYQNDTAKAMVAVLEEEFSRLKEALAQLVEVPGDHKGLRTETDERLKRISDSMLMLGRQELYQQIEEARSLWSSFQQHPEDRSGLLAMADKLVLAENGLQGWLEQNRQLIEGITTNNAMQVELNRAQLALLTEAKSGLEKIKDVIVDFIASQWQRDKLADVSQLLMDVKGALAVLEQDRAARVMTACQRFLSEEVLAEQSVPNWNMLDSLAEALTSIEYFLDVLDQRDADSEDMILSLAEKSVAKLGYPVTALNQPDSPTVIPILKPDTGGSVDPVEEITQSEQAYEEAIAPAESVDEISAEPTSEKHDESQVDDEIVEVFLEEVDEVMATLREQYQLWVEQPDSEKPLTEVRRAFHTLKGGGRMVGAETLGELAWQLENLLNKVLEKRVMVTPTLMAVVELSLEVMPEVSEAFRLRRKPKRAGFVGQLMIAAEALAKGEEVALPQFETHDADTEQGRETQPAVESSDAVESDIAEASLESPAELAIDPEEMELLSIFSEEATQHLSTIARFVEDQRQAAPVYSPPSSDLQAALHTLKGSARMAGVESIGDLATPLENFIKELYTYQLNVDSDIIDLLSDADTYCRLSLSTIPSLGRVEEIPELPGFLERLSELRDRAMAVVLHSEEKASSHQVSPDLLNLLMTEGMQALLDAEDMLRHWQQAPEDQTIVGQFGDELSKVAEAAERAGVQPMQQLAQLLGAAYEQILSTSRPADEVLVATLVQAHHELLGMVDAVAANQDLTPCSDSLQQALSDIATQPPTPAISEAGEAPLDISEMFQEKVVTLTEVEPQIEAGMTPEPVAYSPVEENDEVLEEPQEFAPESAEVSPPVSEAELEQAADSVHEDINETIEEPQTSPQWFEASQPVSDAESEQVAETPVEEANLSEELPAETQDLSESSELPAGEADQEAAATDEFQVVAINRQDIDLEILEIFISEADELLEDIDRGLQQWAQDWQDQDSIESLKRALHTFKGGARMASLQQLGELSHDFETEILTLESHRDQLNEDVFRGLMRRQDHLLAALTAARQLFAEAGSAAPQPESVTESPVPLVTEVQETLPESDQSSAEDSFAEIHPEVFAEPAPESSISDALLPEIIEPVAPQQQRQLTGQQDTIKVSAPLLESLVNLTGETSISRGRAEQQVNDFAYTLDEMQSTIARLKDQVRRIGMETEAHMMFRQEQLEALNTPEGFDPLEMDRYSHLQQLSQSLLESTYDLQDLKETLAEKARGAESHLIGQARIVTDLQERLMRMRLVPFTRIVPRLRRIVRQVSDELGKKVDLKLVNIDGEMDRSVMEQMLAPLEHMIRNSIDHGMEPGAERLAAGKPETGTIFVGLVREGGDILLQLSDDGRGLNTEAIRQRAIERELIAVDNSLEDQDIIQFIFEPGFTTAEKVSQVSGRGVGMDVVNSQVRELGGTIQIHSHPGQGTEFIIRLPFTVSVNRALMIEMYGELYALPLSSVDGVVRMSPSELEQYYRHPDSRLEYAGEQYEVRYLGSLIKEGAAPRIDTSLQSVFMVLVHSETRRYAVQVDGLAGSAEIVAKSLGLPFSKVPGLSGATLMGDGRVVIILDMLGLLRAEVVARAGVEVHDSKQERDQSSAICAMVVDDSVTVRKVTSRFLEREGFEVLTARDGVEAMKLLEDRHPDVMLLDIEMPRMDGFEVAKRVKGSNTLRSIPIIMITSRTGDKHRDRAFALGVERYMGKPYQEDELLTAMSEVIQLAEQ